MNYELSITNDQLRMINYECAITNCQLGITMATLNDELRTLCCILHFVGLLRTASCKLTISFRVENRCGLLGASFLIAGQCATWL